MNTIKVVVLLTTVIAFLISCQPKQAKKEVPETERKPALETPQLPTLPDSAIVQVATENVRLEPNGVAFGKLHKGEKIFIMNRIGNWILFHNSRFDSVFVWGPSVGFNYINLHSPFTYYDSTSQQFYPIDYIQKLFNSSGKKREADSQSNQLFFSNLGLGSHKETVMEVTEQSAETIQHGVRIFINKLNNEIVKVEVDFLNPTKGAKAALEYCDLNYRKPDKKNESSLLWEAGSLVAGLTIKLERTAWKSDQFRSVWFQNDE